MIIEKRNKSLLKPVLHNQVLSIISSHFDLLIPGFAAVILLYRFKEML